VIKLKKSFEEHRVAVTSPGSSSMTIPARDGNHECSPKKPSSAIEAENHDVDKDKGDGPLKLARDGDHECNSKTSSSANEAVPGKKRPYDVDKDSGQGPPKQPRIEPGPSNVKGKGKLPPVEVPHTMPRKLYDLLTPPQPGEFDSLTEPESSEDDRVDRKNNMPATN
jgi:hypothetical protein